MTLFGPTYIWSVHCYLVDKVGKEGMKMDLPFQESNSSVCRPEGVIVFSSSTSLFLLLRVCSWNREHIVIPPPVLVPGLLYTDTLCTGTCVTTIGYSYQSLCRNTISSAAVWVCLWDATTGGGCCHHRLHRPSPHQEWQDGQEVYIPGKASTPFIALLLWQS